jgi:hypothetical protein
MITIRYEGHHNSDHIISIFFETIDLENLNILLEKSGAWIYKTRFTPRLIGENRYQMMVDIDSEFPIQDLHEVDNYIKNAPTTSLLSGLIKWYI